MSQSAPSAEGLAPNAYRLLMGGFMAILAAGVGFAIRGGFLDNWGAEFGFTNKELGDISGMGFTGFCFGIIIGGVICDKIGYGKLVIAAFLLHLLSAAVTFYPQKGMNKDFVNLCLTSGSFIFAFANGTLEAVANPLVATLFFRNRTHYLNILHASWPAGLVLGSACGWILDDMFPYYLKINVHWKYQFALFLIPTALYGLMFLGQHFPKSEASQKGLSLGDMFKDVGILGGIVVCALIGQFFSTLLAPLFTQTGGTERQAEQAANIAMYLGYGIGGFFLLWIAMLTRFSLGSPLLFVLFVAHALVGAVELGTDNWIQNITGNLLTSGQGKMLFVYTSLLMCLLRFCAEFIEKKIGLSPVGILLTGATLASAGLLLTSRVETVLFALVAVTVYGAGKTFFWPTMLAVASDRFPRTGAVAISIMGGIGMMSAGLIGAPGLGYFKDRYAGEALEKTDAALFDQYKAEKPSKFLPFSKFLPSIFPPTTGLDGTKLGEVTTAVADERAGKAAATKEQHLVQDANILGDRNTLRTDAIIPATMAVIYLGLLVYFAAIGGYKPVHIDGAGGEKGH